MDNEEKSPFTLPGLLSVIPGLGQLYNKQIGKGIIFMSVFALFVYQLKKYGISAIRGLITLGSTPMEDHSLFLMITGVLQFILILLFLMFYLAQIHDANKVFRLLKESPDKVGKNFIVFGNRELR